MPWNPATTPTRSLEEEQEFKEFASQPGAMERIFDRIAPNVRSCFLPRFLFLERMRAGPCAPESLGDAAAEGGPCLWGQQAQRASAAGFRSIPLRTRTSLLPPPPPPLQIFGHADIKKAIAALLFGGARKRMPDGTHRRGDINVLLLGDPSTAKSQFLKFASQTAPIAVYTSGKGSSAAGLTASVIR